MAETRANSAAKAQGTRQSARAPERRALPHAAPVAIPAALRHALPPGGEPLPDEVRARMETRFGERFDNVILHRGARAARMAERRDAHAYTLGEHVVLGRGQSVQSPVLAHELAHVVQQRRGAAGMHSAAPRALEHQADAAAAAATAPALSAAPVGIMRKRKKKAGGQEGKPEREDDEVEQDARDERRAQRSNEKKNAERRANERANAGRMPAQMLAREAEQELRALERRYSKPGSFNRSREAKLRDLQRFEALLKDVPGTALEKSQRKGRFDEAQRTPPGTAAQTKHVAGGPALPGMELKPGRDHYAQPDYSIYKRGADGKLVQLHVNLKSDRIDRLSATDARARARQYADQAVRNSAHLRQGEGIIIDFARKPSPAVQRVMLEELFRQGSPVAEVKFGNETHRASTYTGARSPARLEAPSRTRRGGNKGGARNKGGANNKGGAVGGGTGRPPSNARPGRQRPPTTAVTPAATPKPNASNNRSGKKQGVQPARPPLTGANAPPGVAADAANVRPTQGQRNSTVQTPPTPASSRSDVGTKRTAPQATGANNDVAPSKPAQTPQTKVAPVAQHQPVTQGPDAGAKRQVPSAAVSPKPGAATPAPPAPKAKPVVATPTNAGMPATSGAPGKAVARTPAVTVPAAPSAASIGARIRNSPALRTATHVGINAAFDMLDAWLQQKQMERDQQADFNNKVQPEIERRAEALGDAYMATQVRAPGAAYLVVSLKTDIATNENRLTMFNDNYGGIMTTSLYWGTTVEDVRIASRPEEAQRASSESTERIAYRTTLDSHYTTYSIPLAPANFGELIAYAREKHLPVGSLRAHAMSQISELESISPDSDFLPMALAARNEWMEHLRVIDEVEAENAWRRADPMQPRPLE